MMTFTVEQLRENCSRKWCERSGHREAHGKDSYWVDYKVCRGETHAQGKPHIKISMEKRK